MQLLPEKVRKSVNRFVFNHHGKTRLNESQHVTEEIISTMTIQYKIDLRKTYGIRTVIYGNIIRFSIE